MYINAKTPQNKIFYLGRNVFPQLHKLNAKFCLEFYTAFKILA